MIFLEVMLESKTQEYKLQQIHDSYKSSMFSIAYAILHDEGLAEDAVYHALEKIIHYLEEINDISSNKTRSLIVILVKNCAIDILRQRQRQDAMLFEDIDELIDDRISLEEFIIQEESYSNMKQMLSRMDAKYADVLVLRYIHGYKNEEIADLLSISNGNVRFRLHKAKRLLLGILSEVNADEQ
ncbi:sigma-70 family RNA polymerase sigma factor [Hydrogenoanaerobacterium sp.]|uniref:RNA polymerase sigma factor n=1 Tax=Hydrogenoanaerobacterium sp. TaxID=2953763 RepID=UPI002897A237|nr:sigma-70 family RNA polymerase sigma factor [Hydrogenoanaerobacterium sp.]